MTNRAFTQPIRALAMEDLTTGQWVAFCLDLHFTAQAPTFDQLPEMIVQGIEVHQRLAKRRNRKPFTGISYPPISERYVAEFDGLAEGQTVWSSGVPIELRVSTTASRDSRRFSSSA